MQIAKGIWSIAAMLCLGAADLQAGALDAADDNATGPTFQLAASAEFRQQADGSMAYSWRYACTDEQDADLLATAFGASCSSAHSPGAVLTVTEGETVTVVLTNELPFVAGPTSIVVPELEIKAIGGSEGLVTREALNGDRGNTVTYRFTAAKAGTYAFHSGTQASRQIDMGLSGAIVVMPRSQMSAAAAP